jgi:Domain of unknown function (DUF4129)
MLDRRTLGPALLTAAITALLAVVAFASAGSRPWDGEENRPRGVPQSVVDYGYTLLLLLAILALPAIVWIVGMVRAERGLNTKWGLHGLVSLCMFLVAFGIIWTYGLLERFPTLRPETREPLDRAVSGRPPAFDDPARAEVERAEFKLWFAVALVVVLAAGVAYVLYRRRRRAATEQPGSVEEELSAVLDETLDDLRRERDARRAVIAAYARMEHTLAAHGLPRKVFEAPLEYLARVLRELRVGAGAIFALTELFERAKFSPHEIDVGMKEEAIAALVSVRDDLRAAA